MPTLQCRICTKRYREFKIRVTPELTPARRRRLPTCSKAFRIIYGGEWGPVTFPAFKAGDSSLRGWNGGFDFRTPPPNVSVLNRFRSMTDVACRDGPNAPRTLRVNDHENKADFCRPRMSMRGARGISSFQLSVWKTPAAFSRRCGGQC